MQTNLSDVEKRITRYWYTDGLGELIGGGMFILLGLYFATQEYFKQSSLFSGLLQASLVIVLVGGMIVGRWLIKALKSRLTYPRTGFVEYRVDPQQGKKRRMIVAAAFALVMALSIIFAEALTVFFNSTIALTGILVGAILIFLQGRGSGLERFYLLGGLSIILGIVLSVSDLPNGYGLGLFYGLMGVAYLVSGGITLGHYLRENPMPVEESND